VLALAARLTNTIIVEETSLLKRSLSVTQLVLVAQPKATLVQFATCSTGFAYHRSSPKGQAHQQGTGQ
jgi:hypothetical protein